MSMAITQILPFTTEAAGGRRMYGMPEESCVTWNEHLVAGRIYTDWGAEALEMFGSSHLLHNKLMACRPSTRESSDLKLKFGTKHFQAGGASGVQKPRWCTGP